MLLGRLQIQILFLSLKVMGNRLFLIDGHALIFKMYYAFARRPMVNSKGADMSILFGFTKYLLEMINREQPTHIAVSFDPPGGTFRNELYPKYKANRVETPQLVIDALEPLMELCKSLNISVLIKPGFEADDVIGTVAKRFASSDTDVYMVTPDKDYGQLVDDHIFQLKPGKAGERDTVIDKVAVCDKYGICNPAQVIDMLAICGDSSDNIPGVKGVGEVGASKLISKYGSLGEIYSHLDELSAKQRLMFEEAEDHIALSHKLVTINTNVPVDVQLEDMALNTAYSTEVADLFEKYEFSSLRKYLGEIRPSEKKRNRLEYTKSQADVFLRESQSCTAVGIALHKVHSFQSKLDNVTLGIEKSGRIFIATMGIREVAPIIENENILKCGYGLKDMIKLLRFNGLKLKGRLDDIELMHYLVDPEKSHKIDILAASYLDVDIDETEENQTELGLFDEIPEQNDSALEKEVAVVLMLEGRIKEEMGKHAVNTIYDQIEEPLIPVLASMEYEGVKVDLPQLKSFADKLRKAVADKEKHIRELAGDPALNVSSPKQIGTVIYEKLRLDPRAKKSSRGNWSTDEATLREIADKHPIINEILEFRELKKLLSTYIEPFPSYVSEQSGKVHTTFNQALTATGRLSSSNPNLQNIPVRSERGKEIRKAFVPSRPDGLIFSADYSQIELRIMAELSADEHMVESFRNGVDVHRATAAKIFKTSYEEVSPEQRRIAKTANFGIMYGISSFGLAQRLNLSRTDAKRIIDDYFAVFPSIKAYISASISSVREKGYAETIFGRKRYIADINSSNATVRANAERNAVNAPIQGTAADMIKIAMIRVAERLEESGLKSRMILQIHDELLFDAYADELEDLKELVITEMENVINLSIPMTAECGYGKNWLEAH